MIHETEVPRPNDVIIERVYYKRMPNIIFHQLLAIV